MSCAVSFSTVEREMIAMGSFQEASNYFEIESCRGLGYVSKLPQNSAIIDILPKYYRYSSKNKTNFLRLEQSGFIVRWF
jgi:hypothetical protein